MRSLVLDEQVALRGKRGIQYEIFGFGVKIAFEHLDSIAIVLIFNYLI
jgi:hypothetical protein